MLINDNDNNNNNYVIQMCFKNDIESFIQFCLYAI